MKKESEGEGPDEVLLALADLLCGVSDFSFCGRIANAQGALTSCGFDETLLVFFRLRQSTERCRKTTCDMWNKASLDCSLCLKYIPVWSLDGQWISGGPYLVFF